MSVSLDMPESEVNRQLGQDTVTATNCFKHCFLFICPNFFIYWLNPDFSISSCFLFNVTCFFYLFYYLFIQTQSEHSNAN